AGGEVLDGGDEVARLGLGQGAPAAVAGPTAGAVEPVERPRPDDVDLHLVDAHLPGGAHRVPGEAPAVVEAGVLVLDAVPVGAVDRAVRVADLQAGAGLAAARVPRAAVDAVRRGRRRHGHRRAHVEP